MSSKFKYLKNVPIWKTILGIIIALLSIYFVLSGALFGIIPIAYSLLLLQTEGTEINLENKTYRKIYSIIGLNFGRWKPLPEIEYVSVFATTETTKVWVSSATANVKEAVFMINLFHNTNQKIEICNAYSNKRAFDIGSHIAFILDVDILDATIKGDFKWIDKDELKAKHNLDAS